MSTAKKVGKKNIINDKKNHAVELKQDSENSLNKIIGNQVSTDSIKKEELTSVKEIIENNEGENNENCKKKKGGRQSRKVLYKIERNELLKKLYTILEITDDNKRFYLYDIENHPGKKDKILALQDDAKKYFYASNWAIFCKKKVDRPHMSLIRSILKDMDIKFFTIKKTVKIDGKNVSRNGVEIV